jgi:hypothetical protein
MGTENIFFYFLSIITFVYAVRILVILFLDRNKISETHGKIIHTEFVLPEMMKHRNAKLVTFEYYVDGKRYISENQLKMPLSVEVGDIKDIKYYIDRPNVLYTKTYIHFHLAFIASIICFLLGLLPY